MAKHRWDKFDSWGWIMFLPGVLLLLMSALFLPDAIRFKTRGVSTVGVVVELQARSARKGTAYFPVVRYKDHQGRWQRIESQVGGDPPAHDIGDKVNVLYLRETPWEGVLDTFFGLWGTSFIMVILGLGFTGFAWGYRRSKLRQR